MIKEFSRNDLIRFWLPLAAISIFGFLLRFWLAFGPFNNQGFAWDTATFGYWIDVINTNGLDAYAQEPAINYPPAFAEVLVAINWLAGVLGLTPYDLIKLPALIADIGIAVVLALAGKKWFSGRIGVWAVALYLVLPITWYDSAIWGQVDSLSALPMLIAVVLLIDKKPEWSLVAFTIAVLTKPQGALILLILLPVLIGQFAARELRWWRSLTSLAAALATFSLVAVPWSLEGYVARYVSEDLARIPVLGDLLGLMVQYISTAGMFPVLTANAYNIWATASDMPLATQITSGVVYWTTDDYPVFGIPSGVIGGALFLAVAATIFWILIRRRDAQSVLTGFALLLVAFFALPTRVHERYLVQAFAVLALVWAAKAWHRAALGVLAVANTVNLHAILAQDLRVETVPYVSAPAASTEGLFTSARTPVIGAYMPEDYGLSWVRMDAQWAREPWVVYLVVLIHTASFGVLLLQFIKRKNRTPITPPISNRKEEQ